MSYERTIEHRILRAGLIRQWQPWNKSTGPTSIAGKRRSSRNAYKGKSSKMLQLIRRELESLEKNLLSTLVLLGADKE